MLKVRPLDESKNTGWTDENERFCLPLSAGYYIKFPKKDEPTQMFMAWFHHDPIGGSSSIAETRKLAQEHHQRRILACIEIEPAPTPRPDVAGWQPIETAPKDGRHVILYCDYYGIGRCAWESWRGVWRSDDPNHGIGFPQPTHWMPLPDFPADSVRAENARRASLSAPTTEADHEVR